MSELISKTRTQLEDIVYNRNSIRKSMNIVLSIANRRGLPIPAALHVSSNYGEASSDMGDGENFLTQYMIPNSNKCFVDVGANVGGWSFIVALKGFEVFSFEPSPKAFNVLNTRSKKFPKVHAFPYAIGDQDTTGRMGTSALSNSGTMDEENNLPGGGTINVQVHKLDSMNLNNVGVIKIDTEGYETPTLRGATETMRKFKPRLVIEVHRLTGKAASTYSEELKRIENIIDGMGYSWMVRYRPVNLRGDMQPFVIATYQK
jgi:FkbM family methyltransferase